MNLSHNHSTSPNNLPQTSSSTHGSDFGSTQLYSENHLQQSTFSKQNGFDQQSNKRKVEEKENNHTRSKKHKRTDNTNAFAPLINSLYNLPIIGSLVESISAVTNFILLPPHIRNKGSGIRNTNTEMDEMSQGQIPVVKHKYISKKKRSEEAKRTLNTSSTRDSIFEHLQREPEMQTNNNTNTNATAATITPNKTTTQQFRSPGLSPINGTKSAEAEMNGAWLQFLTKKSTNTSPDSKTQSNDVQTTRRDWKDQLTVASRRKQNKRNSLDSSLGLSNYNDASSISFDLSEFSQVAPDLNNNNNDSRMMDQDYESTLIQAKQRLQKERKSIQEKLGKSRDLAIDLTDDTSFITPKQERKRSNSESTLQQLQILLARNEHRKQVTTQEAELREQAITQSLNKLRTAAAEKIKQDQAIINQIKRRTEAEKGVKKLTEEEEKIVELALDGDDDEVLAEGFNMKVTREDICRLRTPEWLNDEVINFYMNVLMDRNSKDPAGFPKIFIFNTFFFSMLEKGYERVKKWTRKVDVFSLDYLIIPVHLGVHWCLAAINFVEKRFEYYDSMGSPNKAALKAMRSYLVQEYKDKKKQQFDLAGWTDHMPRDIPQQQNGYDCGVFMCRYADCIAQNKPFTFKQKDMQTIRKRMILDILSKSYSG